VLLALPVCAHANESAFPGSIRSLNLNQVDPAAWSRPEPVGNTAVTDHLVGAMSILTLSTDRERAPRHVPRLAREQIFLDSTVLQRIREVVPAGADAAVFAAFQVLLYRLTGQEHFTIDVCAPARAVREALMTLGSADGAVAVACQTSGDSRFGSLIAAADAVLHQRV